MKQFHFCAQLLMCISRFIILTNDKPYHLGKLSFFKLRSAAGSQFLSSCLVLQSRLNLKKIFWLWSHCQKRCQISPLSRKFEYLFSEKGGKFKLSAQGQDLAPFVGDGTRVKILSEIKLHLVDWNQTDHLAVVGQSSISRQAFIKLSYCH